ncbi:MAG: amidohydrolase [Chloroflexota bacterium]
MLVNARVLTLDPGQPVAEALAIQGDRICAVGMRAELSRMVSSQTQVLDAGGGTAVPGFHDAHLHLLSYARATARVDCSEVSSLAELVSRIAARARCTLVNRWVRAVRFDEYSLPSDTLPDRHVLDRASVAHPVRLQHRSLHLDVLNTMALRELGIWDTEHPSIEREELSGEPTGRLFHAAELLRGRLERPPFSEIAAKVREACTQLASYGVTTIQDASLTNGLSQWKLFHQLAAGGHLAGLRVFMMPGMEHWQEVPDSLPATASVRLGPVKLMLNEGHTNPCTARAAVAEAHAAGRAVAVHAVSEAELVLALDALTSVPGNAPRAGPDRIEHGAVIPEALLGDLQRAGVTVVGQPGLVYDRGDVYAQQFAPELHAWVHRANSLLQAGIAYAIGSDAPVLEPRPLLSLLAAHHRMTRSGARLRASESLTLEQGLRAITSQAARSVGMGHDLGRLQPGALADVTVLAPHALDSTTMEGSSDAIRITIGAGRILWHAEGF